MTIKPPHDTHGSANHRFYWKSPEVAAAVANAGETPASLPNPPPEASEC